MKKSSEKRNDKDIRNKYIFITLICIVAMFIIMALFLEGLSKGIWILEEGKIGFVLIFCIVIGILSCVIEALPEQYKRRIESEQVYRKYLVDRLESEQVEPNIQEEKDKNNRDIIALMLKNNDEITEYFRISKSQAKSSFWFSVTFCGLGLIALLGGVCGIFFSKDGAGSIVSLISGSVLELISGTIFWVHNKSALQLNHYYDALHENEKFLSAVNIAEKLSSEKKEDILIEIIRKQISSDDISNIYNVEK